MFMKMCIGKKRNIAHLIAVDEILECTKEAAFPMAILENEGLKYDYDPFWQDVKEEIEQL